MAKLRFLARAADDVRGIARESQARWGRKRTAAYQARLRAMFRRLAERPGLGQPVPRLGSDHRRMVSGSHVIIYRDEGDGIVIVRVLHGRMDMDQQY